MKQLIKVILVFAAVFATTFLVAKSMGLLTVEQIEGWLNQLQQLSPFYVGGLVILLLFLDLFITVPTLTVTILAGYFLGFAAGALASAIGLMFAGLSGYALSHLLGDRVLRFLVKEAEKRNEMRAAFHEHGFAMILLSRAVPMLPEITACMAGLTGLGFSKFIVAWLISTTPYVLIAAYSGSVSSLNEPMPAIFAAIGISSSLWFGWFIFFKSRKAKAQD